MILVICMAGLNTRFHDVGFDVPKYLLPWDGGCILDGILDDLQVKKNFSRVIFLPNRRDAYFRKQLVELAARHGVAETDVVYIGDTEGQAHTAAIGANLVCKDPAEPQGIAFHNADTILRGRDWPQVLDQMAKRDVFVDVFPSSSPAFSYVALEGERVTGIKEKKVISPFASSGFYAFQSAGAYLRSFNACVAGEAVQQRREAYISGVIQFMIDGGADVFANELNIASSTVVLGTPEEYGIELAKKMLGR